MSEPNNHIVFLCYGYEPVFLECGLALLSLSYQIEREPIPGLSICIYTDKPEWFSRFKDCPLPLSFRKIDDATITRWRGTIDFTHRVKIEALLDFTTIHQGNILYSDTDVVFRRNPIEIFNRIADGQLYMHVAESRVCDAGNPILEKLNNYLSGAKMTDTGGTQLNSYTMWNAGVLGMRADHKELLTQVLTFTDHHYPAFPKHIVEQFAFSVAFTGRMNIKTAAPTMTHYWNLKELRVILASFFTVFQEMPWTELQKLSQLFLVDVLLQEKSNFYLNRSIADKIMGKKWQPAIPDWEHEVSQI